MTVTPVPSSSCPVASAFPSSTPPSTRPSVSSRTPGMHGFRGSAWPTTACASNEKQKLKYHYCVQEAQFRRFIAEASRRPGNAGDVLLQVLERRLDNVVRRAGLAHTIWGAEQLIAHGHVKVNGRKVDRPSYLVRVGDTITFKEKIGKVAGVEAMESLAGHEVAGWINFNPAELNIKIVSLPTPDQIPFDINANLIVEFYR